MDRGAWQATVHGVAKSQACLSTITHSLTLAGAVFLLRDHPIWGCQNGTDIARVILTDTGHSTGSGL